MGAADVEYWLPRRGALLTRAGLVYLHQRRPTIAADPHKPRRSHPDPVCAGQFCSETEPIGANSHEMPNRSMTYLVMRRRSSVVNPPTKQHHLR